MKLRILKLHPNAQVPVYAHADDACFDLTAATVDGKTHIGQHIDHGHPTTCGTGLAFEVPADHVMLVFSRSGHGCKQALRLANCVGVIDPGYTGEVKVALTQDLFYNDVLESYSAFIKPGDRIAQALILPVPRVEFEVAEQLTITERGAGGFGSTDQGDGSETDPLYKQALLLVTYTKKTSISYVQAHMGIGYNRAARLLETMEKKGILSPMDSSGQRKIIWKGGAA